jgi:fibronectin type 3 domain-containing protein
VINIKSPSADILDFKIGLEVDISQDGAAYGLGGDSGDDIDGFDAADKVYWAQDDDGTTLGFGSAVVSEPITHYFSEDTHPVTYDDYKALWEDEDWLYSRISAGNSTEGGIPGNRTSTVGWNGVTIPGGSFRTFTLVIAINNTFDDLITAVKDAQWYYKNGLTGLQITEFSDSEGTHEIEVYNNGAGSTNSSILEFSIDGGSTFLTGTWDKSSIPTYDYGVFTVTGGGTIGSQGDTIGLYASGLLIDEVAFGQEGVAPDPLPGESVARHFDSANVTYTDEWVRQASTGDTFGAQNDVPPINSSSYIILNEVMFNPDVEPEGKYIVIINRHPSWIIDISKYILVCDSEYVLPDFPIVPGGFDGLLFPPNFPQSSVIIKFGDDSPNSDAFFNSIDSTGDNIYLYQPDWRLCDMVGWSSPHQQGMSVARIPDGNGTTQGYNDASSVAAGWVFNNPLEVIITEISDDNSTNAQIEVFNPKYPSINFSSGYTFESDSGPVSGSWGPTIIDAGQYALFNLTSPGLRAEGDNISLLQNSILIEKIPYGQNGEVPDPLDDESVQRYWTGSTYTDMWARNYTTGPNFGSQNDIPAANLSSYIMLNEVLFHPNVLNDYFIEVINRGTIPIDISGYRIVCDTVNIVPNGTILDVDERYYYLLYSMDNAFFEKMDASGDNVYLYDSNGSLLDMVGWSSTHSIDKTMSRIPDGNGTRNGYDDISSYLAGWRFNRSASVKLIKIETKDNEDTIKYGKFGGYIIYNLTVTNLQSTSDIINILNSSEEGWQVEIYNETMTNKISQISLGPNGYENITVKITLPNSFPFKVMDTVTVEIRSTSRNIISDQIILNPQVLGFIYPEKYINPTEIYINGSGHDETATITMNLTGYGALYPLDMTFDCVFCIDSSGSMTMNDPMNLRISETQNFVSNYFEEDDRGAVVDFDNVATLVGGDHLSTDHSRIINNLGLIDSNGGTSLAPGLNLSNEELRNYGDLDHARIIILLTDAELIDPSDFTASYNEVNISADHEIIIFTIGLNIPSGGESEQLLIDIANITGGIYYPAPDPLYFSFIYENISNHLSERYKTDIAGYDPDINDSTPMVRDVLPPWIDYIPSSFSISPDTIYVNESGYTIIEWNISWIKVGETWGVSFDIVSNQAGNIEANNYTASRIMYKDLENSTVEKLFPLTTINVIDEFPQLGAPTNLDALAGIDHIDLSWNAPTSDGGSPIINYRVYKGTSPGLETFYIMIGNITSYNDTSVTSGVTYYYKVSAVNGTEEGPLSNEAFATALNVPFAPINLTVESGNGYITLEWEIPISDGGSLIINYMIYRGVSSGSEIFYELIGDITIYNDTNVTPGITYYYRVSAINIIGEGPLSNEAYATPPTSPSTPMNLAAESGDAYVNLTWEVPTSDGGSPIIGYCIYRNGTSSVYASVPSDQLWYIDNDVTPGINYTYDVTAINGIDEGPRSSEAEVKAGTVPTSPTDVEATSGDSYVLIMWGAPLSDGAYQITNYTIYRGVISGEEVFLIRIGNESSFNDTEVVNEITYYYKIFAVNDIGESVLFESVNATPRTITVTVNQPPTVTITSPLPGSTISGAFEILGTASDLDGTLQRVEIKMDDGNWMQVSGTTSWGYDWDTTSVSNGEHIITVRSYDGINYSSEINVSIEVNNPESERQPDEEPWIWVLIIIIVIIMISVIIAWAFNNRKKSEGEEIEEKPIESDEDKAKSLSPSDTEEDTTPISPSPSQDMPDDEIFEIIREKYDEGKISEETFQDFKKRYGKE